MSQSAQAYSTQLPDELDYNILKQLEEIIGENDRKTCEQKLVDAYDNDDTGLNHIRESVYDVAKAECGDFPEGILIKRVNRSGQTKSVAEKYASDVYLLFKFVKGAIPAHVIQTDVLSRPKQACMKPTTDVAMEKDKDILSSVLAKLMFLHEDVNKKFDSMRRQLDQFQDKYDRDMLQLISAYDEKSDDIDCP